MADITIRALYGSVVEDEGGPVWFEVNDEGFGAEDAVEAVKAAPKGIEIALRPDLASVFGWARSIAVRIVPDCEDAAPALDALRTMLGPAWHG